MASSSRFTPETLASIALVVTIVIVSVALVVVGTNLHPVARVAISVGSGVIAAVSTFVVAGSRRGPHH